ncbi:DUF2848 family protein [Amycolatopsis granulosa]|uniref:DUF2848 family protein n=1 Tax=Amycolatopsis granulosa TaxID=185684 RepID=UPI00142176DA|nr:DUF2848 family protein [Amycolatopsis granulosa]NIH86584.1 4-hydroxyphenylacetate 3-monooxygenase [Amycolatopsis granulosa]
MTALRFTIAGGGDVLLTPTDLTIAGYTGRDQAAVRHHIAELAAIGVPEPETVPAFFDLDPGLLTCAAEVTVSGPSTSGEVEPVLIVTGGHHYLTVGSDHTDRALERQSIAGSKAACPKPVARSVIDLGADPSALPWDDIVARSWVDHEPYQEGTLAGLLPAVDVLESRGRPPTDGSDHSVLVLFGGTLPLLDGAFRYGRDWRLSLHVPGFDPIEHTYHARVRST